MSLWKFQDISSNLHWKSAAPADTGENTSHTPGKEPNCLCAAAATFPKEPRTIFKKILTWEGTRHSNYVQFLTILIAI